MRIMMITPSFYPVSGGVQRIVGDLSAGLQRRGHDICVVTSRYPRTLPSRDTYHGIPVTRYLFLKPGIGYLRPFRPDLFLASLFWYPYTSRALIQLLRSFQPQIIHVHSPHTQVPFINRILRSGGLTCIVSTHGYDIERFFRQNNTGAGMPGNTGKPDNPVRSLFANADKVTANSDDLLNKIHALGLAAGDRTVRVYNGVDCRIFEQADAYAGSRPYIFSFGRLTHIKGFDLLILAFSHIMNEFPDTDLWIAGSGEQEMTLKVLCRHLGTDNRIRFIGEITHEEVARYLKGALFVVIPSREESFGLAAVEAMAAGKMVLGTDTGGLGEILKKAGVNTVAPEVEALAGGLREYLHHDPHSYTDYRTILSEFSIDTYLDRIESVYREAVNKHPLPEAGNAARS